MLKRLLTLPFVTFSMLALCPPLSSLAETLEITPQTGETLRSGVKDKWYEPYQLKATGGTKPYKWVEGTNKLPPGLKLDEQTGQILGTPTTVGPDSPVDIKVTDESAPIASKEVRYFITVHPDQATKDKFINDTCFTSPESTGEAGDLSRNLSVGPTITTQLIRRGGSACLDSFCQFISGAWRIADYAAVCRVVRLS